MDACIYQNVISGADGATMFYCFLVREDDFKLAVAVYSVVFFSAAGLDLHDSIQIQWLWMPYGFNTIS